MYYDVTYLDLGSMETDGRDYADDFSTRITQGLALDDYARRKSRQVVVILLLHDKAEISICILSLNKEGPLDADYPLKRGCSYK
jgi:hypothetical protein